ncbi:MAG: hypothetical protein Q4D58_04410 [Synergistaceae bacterium]|nr:hypothetical protein [Synergistaceae bacterium]
MRRRGFFLSETLITLLLAAILAGAAISLLSTSMRLAALSDSSLDAENKAYDLCRRMSAGLSTDVPYETLTAGGVRLRRLTVGVEGGKSAVVLYPDSPPSAASR